MQRLSRLKFLLDKTSLYSNFLSAMILPQDLANLEKDETKGKAEEENGGLSVILLLYSKEMGKKGKEIPRLQLMLPKKGRQLRKKLPSSLVDLQVSTL